MSTFGDLRNTGISALFSYRTPTIARWYIDIKSYMHDARRRETAWGGLWPDWVLFMFTNRSCLPKCYDVDDILLSCYKEPAANTERLFPDNQQHFR